MGPSAAHAIVLRSSGVAAQGDFAKSRHGTRGGAATESIAESAGYAGTSPTERRWNRTIQAEGCSALPVLKTGCVTDSPNVSPSDSDM
jgi:hypothetical protein